MQEAATAARSLETLHRSLQALDAVTGGQSVLLDEDGQPLSSQPPDYLATLLASPLPEPGWHTLSKADVFCRRLRSERDRSDLRLLVLFPPSDGSRRCELETVYQLVGAPAPTRPREDEIDVRMMFQSVLDTIPVRVFWKDLESVYLGCNQLFAEDAGRAQPQELIGKTDHEMAWTDEAELYRADDRLVMDTGQSKVHYEEPQTRPNGEVSWVQTSKIPLKNARGETFGVLGTYHDITPRKMVEAEREELLEELERKNAELERFTYTVSHDLKSPLVTIKGFLGFLEQDVTKSCPPETQAQLGRHTQRIRRAADTMHELLEDLLEMSRVGHALGPRQQEDLRHLVDDALLLCSGTLAQSNAAVHLSGTFPHVHVDGPRIVQVIQNLVENACKYRRPDRPLKLTIRGSEDGRLEISDNGIGIPKRYYDHIFGLFEKLDPSTEGSGIGLALVKRIVENHDGVITVDSNGQGKGTTFHIHFPLVEESPEASGEPQEKGAEG